MFINQNNMQLLKRVCCYSENVLTIGAINLWKGIKLPTYNTEYHNITRISKNVLTVPNISKDSLTISDIVLLSSVFFHNQLHLGQTIQQWTK